MLMADVTKDLIFPTGGGCMRPWIWPGGMLHVRPCVIADLRVGDIAVWFDGRRLLSHRVVDLLADGRFVTRGDWYKRSDAPADTNQLVGVAVRFVRGPISYSLTWSRRGRLGRIIAAYRRNASRNNR